jgi:ribosomal protein S18 acetylase RimI-like enzyme
MYRVRVATVDDATAIREVGIASWWATYTPYVPAHFIAKMLNEWWSTDKLSNVILNQTRYTTVVESEDNDIVGMMMTGFTDNGAYIWRWYLRADVIGKGLGKMLWQDLHSVLPQTTQYIELDYFDGNNHARDFYTRLGFVETHRNHLELYDCKIPMVYMRYTVE